MLAKPSAKVMHKLLFNRVCKWSDRASQPGHSVITNAFQIGEFDQLKDI